MSSIKGHTNNNNYNINILTLQCDSLPRNNSIYKMKQFLRKNKQTSSSTSFIKRSFCL